MNFAPILLLVFYRSALGQALCCLVSQPILSFTPLCPHSDVNDEYMEATDPRFSEYLSGCANNDTESGSKHTTRFTAGSNLGTLDERTVSMILGLACAKGWAGTHCLGARLPTCHLLA